MVVDVKAERYVQRLLASLNYFSETKWPGYALAVHEFDAERDVTMLRREIDAGYRIQHAGWNGE